MSSWTIPRPPHLAQMAGTLRRRRGMPMTMRTVRTWPSGSAIGGRRRRRTRTVPSASLPLPGVPLPTPPSAALRLLLLLLLAPPPVAPLALVALLSAALGLLLLLLAPLPEAPLTPETSPSVARCGVAGSCMSWAALL